MATNLATIGVNLIANARGMVAGFSAGQKHVTAFAKATTSSLSMAKRAVTATKVQLAGLKAAVHSVASSIPGFDRGMATMARGLQRVRGGVVSALKGMVRMAAQAAVLSAALVGVGSVAGGISLGVKLAADLEQSTVAFQTMLGSAEAAKGLLAEIDSFAASTPFQFPELVDSTKKLLAFGFAQQDIIPTMRRIGDVAAGLGIPIGELAELYGKARTQGTLMAEDINQLTGRGIPIIALLAKQFGIAESEVKKLVSTGAVGFANLEQAFVDMTDSGGQFAGLMEAQSQTLTGLFSTLQDNVSRVLRDIGQEIIDGFDLKEVIEETTDAVMALGKTAIPILQDNIENIKTTFGLLAQAGLKLADVLAFLSDPLSTDLLPSERFERELERIRKQQEDAEILAERQREQEERAEQEAYNRRIANGPADDLAKERENLARFEAAEAERLAKLKAEADAKAAAEKQRQAAAEMQAEQQRAQELQRRADQIFQQTRTPFELARAEAEELVALYREGLVSDDAFLRRQQQIRDGLKQTAEETAAIDRGPGLAQVIRRGSVQELDFLNSNDQRGAERRRQLQLQQQQLALQERQAEASEALLAVLRAEREEDGGEWIPG